VFLFLFLRRRSALLLLRWRLSLLNLRRYWPRFRLSLTWLRLNTLLVLRLAHHLRCTRLADAQLAVVRVQLGAAQAARAGPAAS
jgi:hypothetical protein